jgi:hypothetical protein
MVVGLGRVDVYMSIDHDKNGFDTSAAEGTPPFAGDYFMPGSPWEGWLIEYKTTPTGSDVRHAECLDVGWHFQPFELICL